MSFNTGNITLGGVDLNNSLQWVNRDSYVGVAQNTRRTLGGGLVVYSQSLNAGQPIELVATVDTGWFTYGMVTAIKALAANPGGTHTFEYHGETYTVRFDYEQTAFDFSPLVPKSSYANDTDYFIGTVRLFTV